MTMQRFWLAGMVGLAAVGSVGYLAGRAHADGVPAANPLVYAGTVDDNGRGLEGMHRVALRLWTGETGGTLACAETSAQTAFTGGRFRLALGADCTGAVQRNADLWIETLVDDASYGRAKISAVPYAIEAARASGASGALETRLAALEGGARRRQFESAGGTFNHLTPAFTTSFALIPGAPTLTFTAQTTGRYLLRTAVQATCTQRLRIAAIAGAPTVEWQPVAVSNLALPSSLSSACLVGVLPVELLVNLRAGTSYTFGLEYRTDNSRGSIASLEGETRITAMQTD